MRHKVALNSILAIKATEDQKTMRKGVLKRKYLY